MNELQELMYNDGERLVPYVSHDDKELIRHRSSYAFFYNVILKDIQRGEQKASFVTIADLGFGTGYGCSILGNLPHSRVTGIDITPECETFAHKYYPRSNINYIIEDLTTYIPSMETYDYVVSRGVLEHVPNGLNLIKDIKFKSRVIIDVPYDEAPGNEHHVLTGIKEDAFAHLDNYELFYQDLDGAIYDEKTRPEKSNIIMVVISSPHMTKIKDLLSFPIPPCLSNQIETKTNDNRVFQYDCAEDFLTKIENVIQETEVVADIGCGLAPINYFRPALHFMIEPRKEDIDILSNKFSGDKTAIVINQTALGALNTFGNDSVDSIFLLNVIEHMEKEDGLEVIKECERVARQQIVILTPLGAKAKLLEIDEKERDKNSGPLMQRHKSGWLPDDFSSEWFFHICKNFHNVDHKGKELEESHGVFCAIKNFEAKKIEKSENLGNLIRPTKFEVALNILQEEHAVLREKYTDLQNKYTHIQNKYMYLTNFFPIKVTLFLFYKLKAAYTK